MPSLPPGSRVGPYDVVGAIGAGGMGEVFRAHDRALKRDVALKVLPAAWAEDSGRRQRFAREARLLASLNHPHIAQVYGVEDSAAGPAIAMEFVEGRTLREMLQAGALERPHAIELAREIALALDAAHEKSIIHRDLKPANIVVTREGSAKVLDFGLAMVWSHDDGENEATRTNATEPGSVLGTPAYMSPEQARGQPVDRRTDIWAFGCILFELFARRPAFDAPTVSDTLAAILERDPEWSALPGDTPPAVRQLIRRCLAKDRRHRLRDIGDALHELGGASGDQSPDIAGAGHSSPGTAVDRRRTLAAVLALATVALAATTLWLLVRDRREGPMTAGSGTIRFALPPPAGTRFESEIPRLETISLAVSPDGSMVAFIATGKGRRSEVWLRSLGDEISRVVPGTEGAVSMFWSPDGRALGFFAAGQLKRVDLAGGAPVKLCDVPRGVGVSGTWSPTGNILFASIRGDGIYRVSAAGGSPTLAIAGPASDHPGRVVWPHVIDAGGRFVYSALGSSGGRVMMARPDGTSVVLLAADSRAEWVDPDWLLFVREGTLLAQRVDLNAGRVVGDPVSVTGGVGHSAVTAWSAFSASPNGTLVIQSQQDESRMVWFDRSGREIGEVGPPASYYTVRLSPDGSRLAFSRLRAEVGTYDLWMRDLSRGSDVRLTSAPGSEVAETWLPNGRSIVFASGQGEAPNVFIKDLSTGVERRLLSSPRFQWVDDVSPDGTQVAYRERTEAGDWNLWLIRLDEPGKPVPLFVTAASEAQLKFAPSGRLIAFVSDVSTVAQVYLSPYPPNGSPPTPVSSTGGSAPRWRRDGRELFYLSAGGLMVVPIDDAGRPGTPRMLFATSGWTGYDSSPNGDRFIAVVPLASERDQPLSVIVGWPPAGVR